MRSRVVGATALRMGRRVVVKMILGLLLKLFLKRFQGVLLAMYARLDLALQLGNSFRVDRRVHVVTQKLCEWVLALELIFTHLVRVR